MSVAKTDLKYYLTTNDAGTSQNDPSQSIGGYISTTPFNDNYSLTSILSQSATSISSSGTVVENTVLIDDELIELSGGVIQSRGFLNTLQLPHDVGSVVSGLTKNTLFNNSFSSEYTQYRCIAVRNENLTNSFYNLNFYVKNASNNPNTSVLLGVEYAANSVVSGVATGGGSISLVDTTLVDAYIDNYFINCPLTFTSGTNINLTRVIASFDSATGTITFKQSLTVPVSSGMAYRIGQQPSQRLVTGTIAPSSSPTFSGFGSYPISINIGSRGSATLAPFETVYIWLQRQLSPNVDQYLNNSFVFTARYTTA